MKILFILTIFIHSCAVLHHVQVGDIDNRNNPKYMPIEVKVSELGLNISSYSKKKKRSKFLTNRRKNKNIETIVSIVNLFQMGPVTGHKVLFDSYAKNLIYMLHKQCPSGKITGIQSIRESSNYSAISGEIVKVTGYCIM